MGIVYGFIGLIILTIVLCCFDLDYIAFPVIIIPAILLALLCVIPHPSFGTEVVDSTTYELISLYEIDEDKYTKNDYLLYEPVNDRLIFYYKDSKGLVRREDLPANSSNVKIVYSNEKTKYTIDVIDYDSKIEKHLYFQSFNDNYTLSIPKDSVIQSLIPEYIG